MCYSHNEILRSLLIKIALYLWMDFSNTTGILKVPIGLQLSLELFKTILTLKLYAAARKYGISICLIESSNDQ